MSSEKTTFIRRYSLITVAVAAVLALMVVLRWKAENRIDSTEDRIAYLSELGWVCDPDSEQCREICLPESFGRVLSDYNELQLADGFDLSRYAGKTCTQYIYTLENHAGSITVYAVLYIYHDRVIGGDIHTAVLDGYMHGLKSGRG